MTIVQFLRLLNRNLNLLLLSSLCLALVTFFITKNQPKEFKSETEIYTGIASGLNVASLEAATMDYFATSNEYDNLLNIIKSRQTLEEVGERLLVKHMMADSMIIYPSTQENLNYMFPPSLQDSLIVEGSPEETWKNVKDYKRRHYTSQRVKLAFFDGTSPYCYQAIDGVAVSRIGNSDLVKLEFTWSDPGICQEVLQILNEVFTRRSAEIKLSQSGDVVEYFKNKVNDAKERAELYGQRLKKFREDNKIVNYEEQTKQLTAEQQKLQDDYNMEVASRASSKAALSRLDTQLSTNKEALKVSAEILKKKNKLSKINGEIAKLEVYQKNSDLLSKLKLESERLKAELSDDIYNRYQLGRTTEGIQTASLLSEWLDYSLSVDESEARINLLKTRMKEFDAKFARYASMGSEIDNILQEIKTAQETYLGLQLSLNTANMKQQGENIASGGLVVTVAPYFPLQPLKSKKLILVMVSAVLGFALPFIIIFLIEFLDASIKTPKRAEEYTGLEMLGAYPDLSPRSEIKHIDMDWLHEHSMGLMSQNLRVQARRSNFETNKPKKILAFSTRASDGKNLMMHLIVEELVSLNHKVLVLSYADSIVKRSYDFKLYNTDKTFIANTKGFESLVDENVKLEAYDYVFVVLKPIITEPYPMDLLEDCDIGLAVLSVNHSWKQGDTFALKEFVSNLNISPRLVVNGVSPDYMDVVLGDIKKNRSFLRKLFKSIVTLQFKMRPYKSKD